MIYRERLGNRTTSFRGKICRHASSDGGALAMKTYGHLRQEEHRQHGMEMLSITTQPGSCSGPWASELLSAVGRAKADARALKAPASGLAHRGINPFPKSAGKVWATA